jgi:antitoxin MazE
MKTRIVRIGNSQGVRIPRPLIEEAGLSGEVDISVHEGSIIIKSIAKPRAGWSAAFAAMANQGDDSLIDDVPPSSTDWDESEWQW